MWFTIGLTVEEFWRLLPDITTALRFITALFGVISMTCTLRRQIRRGRRDRQ
jgi:hypothetical protein